MGQLWVWILGGAVGLGLSTSSAGLFGALAGGTVAWLFARAAQSDRRIQELERIVAKLRSAGRNTPAVDELKPARPEPPPTAPPLSTPLSVPVATPRAAEAVQVVHAEPPAVSPQPSVAAAPPRAIALLKEFFLGGNALVRSGVVILFIGVAFLLRYLAERTTVPLEVRLWGVAAGAFVLLALGWRLRRRKPGYALALQGGAIGILYLTVFVSLKLFAVLPPTAAFALLVALSVLAIAFAVLQDSLAFAALGVGCGFLAPVLASTGQGDHVVLFGYYAVLNLAIFGIAWFKAWRLLNTMGFIFTFGIGGAWGVLRYDAALFATTEPFLVGFFLLYVAIAVLFATRRATVLRDAVERIVSFVGVGLLMLVMGYFSPIPPTAVQPQRA